MNQLAIANFYNIPQSGNTIIIGSAENKSKFDLENNSSFENAGYICIQSDRITTINFYTDLYTSANDLVLYPATGQYFSLIQCLDGSGATNGKAL